MNVREKAFYCWRGCFKPGRHLAVYLEDAEAAIEEAKDAIAKEVVEAVWQYSDIEDGVLWLDRLKAAAAVKRLLGSRSIPVGEDASKEVSRSYDGPVDEVDKAPIPQWALAPVGNSKAPPAIVCVSTGDGRGRVEILCETLEQAQEYHQQLTSRPAPAGESAELIAEARAWDGSLDGTFDEACSLIPRLADALEASQQEHETFTRMLDSLHQQFEACERERVGLTLELRDTPEERT